MRKIIFILILAIIFTFNGIYANTYAGQNIQNSYLLEYWDYRNIVPENIKTLKIIRYTEAGVSETNVDDKIKIKQFYESLRRIKITNETKMSCTDNTTIYIFTLNDDSKAIIEIECNWVVIKGQNYNLEFSY